ncbi:MarR family winged helix-turn-helix transcriptional regulator [Actinoplanes sp. URMC 104]|uniref:MarR family winged helix-turn-helix transcriptional regulator n=1 Tax=Actinoplanes sp. URMC 104 TaxID=3423409 RepID=UPI003F1AE4B6
MNLATSVVDLAPQLHRALVRRADTDFEHPRPPEAQVAALGLIRRRPGITVRELATDLQLKPNNASSLITAMVTANMLRKEHDGHDRRIVRLYLTDEARLRHDAVQALFTGYASHALDALSADERTALEAALPALHRLACLIRDPRR